MLALGSERCSIAGTLDALGDTWSIMVLRELFFGVHRFNDLQRDLGISRSVLSDRLARLVDLGVVHVVPYREPGDRARNEYRLTRKGVDLLPVMVSLMSWGDRHLNDDEGPARTARPGHGRDRCGWNCARRPGGWCKPTRWSHGRDDEVFVATNLHMSSNVGMRNAEGAVSWQADHPPLRPHDPPEFPPAEPSAANAQASSAGFFSGPWMPALAAVAC